jgi:hypothetical protein
MYISVGTVPSVSTWSWRGLNPRTDAVAIDTALVGGSTIHIMMTAEFSVSAGFSLKVRVSYCSTLA